MFQSFIGWRVSWKKDCEITRFLIIFTGTASVAQEPQTYLRPPQRVSHSSSKKRGILNSDKYALRVNSLEADYWLNFGAEWRYWRLVVMVLFEPTKSIKYFKYVRTFCLLLVRANYIRCEGQGDNANEIRGNYLQDLETNTKPDIVLSVLALILSWGYSGPRTRVERWRLIFGLMSLVSGRDLHNELHKILESLRQP